MASHTANLHGDHYQEPWEIAHHEVWDSIEMISKCYMCQEKLDSDTNLLGQLGEGTCRHVFCWDCLNDWIAMEQPGANKCPRCRMILYYHPGMPTRPDARDEFWYNAEDHIEDFTTPLEAQCFVETLWYEILEIQNVEDDAEVARTTRWAMRDLRLATKNPAKLLELAKIMRTEQIQEGRMLVNTQDDRVEKWVTIFENEFHMNIEWPPKPTESELEESRLVRQMWMLWLNGKGGELEEAMQGVIEGAVEGETGYGNGV